MLSLKTFVCLTGLASMSSMVTEENHARASHEIQFRKINKVADGGLRQGGETLEREGGGGKDF